MSLTFARQRGSQRSNDLAGIGNRDVNQHRAEPILERLQIRNRISERVSGILSAVLVESRDQAGENVARIVRLRFTNAKIFIDHFQTCRAAVYHAY